MPKPLARPARIRVERQHETHNAEYPRVQLHTTVGQRLMVEWEAHFLDEYANQSSGVELGMQLILYLTGNPHLSAATLAKRLVSTYPDVSEGIAERAVALADELTPE